VRRWVGVLARDLPRYVHLLSSRNTTDHLAICNRNERIEMAPDGSGFRCLWQWTSDLHAPKVVPALGRRLMQRALAAHPIGLARSPAAQSGQQPQVSFLIGHRGVERLPHLQATLKSIAAQQGVAIECIVVEQDMEPRLAGNMPDWVTLVRTPPPAGMPYCRSWALNVAAQHARAPVLILHDNDMLVPVDYAAHVLQRVSQGFDVVNLKRFVFYLGSLDTRRFFDGQVELSAMAPEVIVQNTEGGGSIAITRTGFNAIGGMDESFVGWGGEDNEFWERALTLRAWTWGSLPLVHLWHAAQPGKQDPHYTTARHYQRLTQIDPLQRIRQLESTPRGSNEAPAGVSH